MKQTIWSKIYRSIVKVLDYAGTFCIIMLTIIVALQVFSRQLKISLPWTEELARFFLIWLTFSGCVLAIHNKSHLAVDYFVEKAPLGVQKVIAWIVRIIIIGFFVVITYYGFNLSLLSMNTPSTSLQWPMGIVYMVLPFTGLSAIYILLYNGFNPEEAEK